MLADAHISNLGYLWLLRLDWVIKSAHVWTQNRYASVNASTYTNKSPLSLLTEAAYTPNVWSCTFSSSSTHTSHSISEIKRKRKIFVSVFTRGLFPHALTPWPHQIVHFTTQKNTLQNSGTTSGFFQFWNITRRTQQLNLHWQSISYADEHYRK